MSRSPDRSYLGSPSPSRSRPSSKSRRRSGSLSSTSSGRAAKARDWNGEGGYRLHLSDLAIGVSRREIEKLFRPYGPLNEVWVASNPPCFAFINFRHRGDGERALKELDGKILNGSRIGLSWARPRTYGGRPPHALLRRSTSPSHRRGYRDSYGSRRGDDRYSKRRYSRSRSRSPGYRRSGGSYRRRSPSSESRSRSKSRSRSRSASPRDDSRDKRQKTSKRDDQRRNRRRSGSNSDSDDNRSPVRKNGKQVSRSPSSERKQTKVSNGVNHNHKDDHQADIQVDEQD